VFAADFRDRVVHHFIYREIIDFWDKRFIYDSYSCRNNKGTHFGIKRMSKFLRAVSSNYQAEAWIMKLDLKSYFINIDRNIIWQKCHWGVQKQFRGDHQKYWRQTLLYLLRIVIFADPTLEVEIRGDRLLWHKLPRNKSLFYARGNCGFPIGNLTSQLFSNIYLHGLDCLIKHKLGIKYYGRYVDDFVLMHQSKKRLLQVKKQIEIFLASALHLQLHQQKIYIQPSKYGVAFVGGIIKPYRILPGKRLVKKYLLARRKKYFLHQIKSWNSYLGHLSNYDSWRLVNRVL